MSTSGPTLPSPAVATLRERSPAEILDGAVRLVRAHPRAAFGFALPVALVQAVLVALVLAGTYSSPGLGTASTLLRLLVSLAGASVLAGLFAPVIAADGLGERIGPAEAWHRARGARGVLLLVVLGVGVSLVEDVGLVLAIVGGVWLWGVWAVAAPAMTVERLGPIAAVRRSYRLASRRFWHVWGVRALGWVLGEILALLVTLPFSALAAYVGRIDFGRTTGEIVHPGVFITVTALGNLVSVALVAPILAAVDGLIYLDLRVRVEGLDLVVAAPADPTRAHR